MSGVEALNLPVIWSSTGDGYEFDVDSTEEVGGSGTISSVNEPERMGTLKQRFSAYPYSGKRIKLSGSCRCENVSKTAGLLVRAEMLDGRALTSDEMLDRPLGGTTEWRRCELVIEVPAQATTIAIGAHLKGKGQVWFKDLRIENVAADTPTTDQYAMGCIGLWDLEPVNLDFAQDEFLSEREKNRYVSEARRWFMNCDSDYQPYEMTRPADAQFKGKPIACVRPISNPGTGYLCTHFAAARYRNKRVRYTGYIKTKKVLSSARLFVDVCDVDAIDLLYEKLEPVTGTRTWTKGTFEFNVPPEAYVIIIGAILDGLGEMYVGGLEFDVIGPA